MTEPFSPVDAFSSLLLFFFSRCDSWNHSGNVYSWGRFASQDKSIEEQLSMGIRYFDLRVARKPNDSSGDLYFTHVIYTHLMVLVSILCVIYSVSHQAFMAPCVVNVRPSQETLSSVAAWLDSHPKEVVILACSHFEGISDRLHQAFILSLKKLFGSKLCPREVGFFSSLCRWCVVLKQLTQPNLSSAGIGPDLAESVGIWLPGRPVLRLADCSETSGAVARHPLLVGQPAHSTGSDQLPGLEQRPGTSRWASFPLWHSSFLAFRCVSSTY